jgi:hypothetical protein
VDLLTPVGKAWSTDLGVELTSLAVQVHGGMGYIEETGVAQYFRDSRIAPIYEGTNGIQAIDLVMRKLPMRGGAVVKEFLATIEAEPAGNEPLLKAVAALRDATDWMLAHMVTEPNDALAGATPYLRMFALVAGGWLMDRSARAAERLSLDEKIATARFYNEQLLPQVHGLLPAVTAGASPLYQVDLSR